MLDTVLKVADIAIKAISLIVKVAEILLKAKNEHQKSNRTDQSYEVADLIKSFQNEANRLSVAPLYMFIIRTYHDHSQ